MKVLLLGASGMLGTDLAASAPAAVQLYAAPRSALDITNEQSMARRIADTRPDIVINAAAYTRVDAAESESAVSYRVNSEAVGSIGRLAAKHAALVVHFSTDYVFDGEAQDDYPEDAKTNPLNVYGASKLAGEHQLANSGAPFLIIRTQWLFGIHGRSFPRTMLERARTQQITRVVSDQWGRPTFTVDLARATWELLLAGARGYVHIANTGRTNWYELAKAVFRSEDAEALLTPCRTEDFPTPARRPIRAVLSTNRAERLLGHPLPPWLDAVERFLSVLRAPIE
jgi:dTDP-4-dehydrorhamnose reductase